MSSLFEVRSFTSAGVQNAVLGGATPEFTGILNGAGTLQISLPGVLATQYGMTHNLEVGLFRDGVEIKNSRARLRETEGNSIGAGDAPGTGGDVTWAGRTFLSILEKAIVYPSNWPTVPRADGHQFTTATAGSIMKTLINLAQTRGALTGLTHASWSTTTDSKGVAWASTINVKAETGNSVMSILDLLIRAGMVDVEMDGREMRLYNSGTLGTNMGAGPGGIASPIILRRGLQVVDVPYSETSEEQANAYLLMGDDGVMVERTNGTSIANYGRMEASLSQSGVNDFGTLQVFGDIALQKTSTPRSSITVKVEDLAASFRPFVDYTVGDWISLDRTGTLENYRVRQLSVAVENDDRHTVVATLNDVFLERDLVNERRLEGITGSTSSESGGGTTTPVPNTGTDTLAPKPPTGLTGTSSAYLTPLGLPQAQVTLTWVDPTQNTDNSALDDLKEIRVFVRTDSGTAPWVLASSVEPGTQTAYLSPFDVGQFRRFSVVAIDDANNWSVRSTEYRLQMAADTTPPAPPSTPTATVKLGVATIKWDGKDSGGAAMVSDFDHIDVHVSSASGFTPSPASKIGFMTSNGTLAYSIPTYNTPMYAKFIAYDTSGNASTASTQSASFVSTELTAGDLGSGVAGSRISVSATAPTVPTPTNGDAWVDTANGNAIKIYNGSTWVPYPDANKNKVTYSTSAASGTSGFVNGDTWFQKDANNTVIAQWEFSSGAWVPKTLNNAVIANLDAGKITTGLIDTSRLVVASRSGNLVPNGQMEEIDPITPTRPASWVGGWWTGTAPTVTFETASPIQGDRSMKLTYAANSDRSEMTVPTAVIPVRPGETYYMEAKFKASAAVVGKQAKILLWLSDTKANNGTIFNAPASVSAVVASADLTTGVVTLTGSYTIPATYFWMKLVLDNDAPATGGGYSIVWDEVLLQKRITSAIIDDGSIIASKMAAGSVTTNALVANAVTATKLDVGSVSAEKIQLGVLRQNLIADGSFEEDYVLSPWNPFGTGQGVKTQWRNDASGGTPAARSLTGALARSGRGAMTMPVTAGGTSGVVSNAFVTVVGQEYRLVIHAGSAEDRATLSVSVLKGPTDSFDGFTTETLVGDSTWTSTSVVTNLIADPSAENGVVSGSATNATLSVDTTLGRTGSNSFKLTTTSTSGAQYRSDRVEVVPGDTYQTVGWVRPPAGTSGMRGWIGFYDENDALISSSPSTTFPVTVGQWNRVSATYVAPATARYGRAGVDHAPGSGSYAVGAVINVDDVAFERLPLTADPNKFETFSYSWIATDTNAAVRILNFGPPQPCMLLMDDVSVVQTNVGGASELTAAGLRLFDDEGYEATAMVTNRSNYFSISKNGDTLAAIDDEGKGSFIDADIDSEVTIQGDPLIGSNLGAGLLYGAESPYRNSWLEAFPMGLVQWGYQTASSGTSASTTGIGIYELGFPVFRNRMYRVQTNMVRVRSSVVNDAAELRVHVTTATVGDPTADASTPLVASTPVSFRSPITTINNVQGEAMSVNHIWQSSGGGLDDHSFLYNARFLLAVARVAGTGNVFAEGSALDPIEFWIEDIGPTKANGGQTNAGGGATTITPPKQYTKTFTSTGWAMYNSSNARKTNADDVKQGYSSYDGDSKGLWLFPSMTATLSGATVNRIRVYLYANHWWYNSGGTAKIDVHGASSIPGTWPPANLANGVDSPNWPKPGGRWVTLPSSLYAGFKAGTYKGVAVGPAGTTNLLYYGRFNGSGAKIELTYTK